VTSCFLNTTSNRLLAICQLLSQPPYAHPDVKCTVAADRLEVYLEHKTWGSLATLEISALPASQTLLIIHFPEYPSVAETNIFRTALLLELSPAHSDIRRLASSVFQEEQLLVRLSNELFQVRSEHRVYAMKWFLENLKIWGIDMLDQLQSVPAQGGVWHEWGKRMGLIQMPIAAFDFIIQGAPAEFAVMARESMLRNAGVSCSILNPGTQRKLLEIPVEINPVAVQYRNKDTSLDLVAHKLLNGNTLLKVIVSDNGLGWGFWNAFRDEMERLGWFSLSTLENVASTINLEPEQENIPEFSSSKSDTKLLLPINEPKKDISQIWLTIPDKGWDRECIRLWHRGLTCKDIGRRLEKTDKTILNRLNQLRKEFGEQTVPYRNANYRSG
jgi:hypothetical protein